MFHNPLKWPTGWVRTTKRYATPFADNQPLIFRELERALDELGATNVVVTTDQRVKFDGGLSTAKDATPADPGVAIYFTRQGREVCIPCDRYKTVIGNVRAIGLTLEYMRRMARYGTSEILDAAFRGFTALPESIQLGAPSTPRAWHEVLQLSPNADEDIIRASYRKLSSKYHPDNKDTGDAVLFDEVQKAYKEAMPWKES